MEIEFAKPAVESHAAIPAHHIDAAGPRLIGAFGGAIHAIHDGREGKAEFAEAKLGMLAFFRQVPRGGIVMPSRSLMVLCHWVSGAPWAWASRI